MPNENLKGATGATPTPTSGGSEGSSPASSSSASGKTDWGMSPKADPSSSSTQAPSSADKYGPDFWNEHGDAIFKHDRFKETLAYKKKYEEVAPINEFVQTVGGLEELRTLHQYFGPVMKALMSRGESANQVWSQLYPVLQDLVNNKDISSYFGNAKKEEMFDQPTENDPINERLKPVQDELKSLKEENQKRKQREIHDHQVDVIGKYSKILESKMADKEAKLPAAFKDIAARLIIDGIGKYMPVGPNGRDRLNPIMVFDEAAFNKCWEETVMPKWREIHQDTLSGLKTNINNGGPALPDANANGVTPANGQVPPSRLDKSRRMAQFLSK